MTIRGKIITVFAIFLASVGGIRPIDLDIRIVAATNRELKNIIERAIALTDQSRIQVIDLPPDLQKLDF